MDRSILLLGSQMATGGAQRMLLTQARQFHKRGFRVVAAFFYDKQGCHDKWQAELPCPLINLEAWHAHHGISNFFRLVRGFWLLYRVIRAERFEVIETFTQHANILGIPVAWAAGVPVRVATHHGKIEGFPRWLQLLHNKIVNHGIASCLVTVSMGVNQLAILEGANTDRMFVIPNGIEEWDNTSLNQANRAALCAELRIENRASLVVTVGRLRYQKGHSYLLEAIPPVLAQFPNTIFAIIGDGPLHQDLSCRSQRLGIDHALRFLGNRSDIHELLNLADVFVLPSLWEGHPVALLEAMSQAVPCIATNVEGVAETLQDSEAALLVPPANAEALSEAIIRLLRDVGLRKRLGQAGKELVERTCTDRCMCDEYEDLFTRLQNKRDLNLPPSTPD